MGFDFIFMYIIAFITNVFFSYTQYRLFEKFLIKKETRFIIFLNKYIKNLKYCYNIRFAIYLLIYLPVLLYLGAFLKIDLFLKLIFIIIMHLYLATFFEGTIFNKIYYVALYFCIDFIVEIPLNVIYSNLISEEVHKVASNYYTVMLYQIILAILFYFVVDYIGNLLKVFKSFFKTKDYKYIQLIIISLALLYFVILRLFFILNELEYYIIFFIATIPFAYLLYCIYIISRNTFEYTSKLENYKFVNETIESYNEYKKLTEHYIDEAKKIEHDIENNYSLLSFLLHEEKYDIAKKVVNDFKEDFSNIHSFVDVEDELLSFILTQKLTYAKNNNVNLTFKIMTNEKINLKSNHLIGLFFNILDNSIQSAKNSNNKVVTLEIKTIQNKIFIITKNSVNDAKVSLNNIKNNVSSKKCKESHGYGTLVINSIVEENNGDIKYYIENDEIVTKVILNNIRKLNND